MGIGVANNPLIALNASDAPTIMRSDSSGGLNVSHQAGARHVDNPALSFTVVRDGVPNLSVIILQTAVTIGGGVAADTNLKGLLISAALTGTCVVTGFQDSAGAAASITFPAATAAGFISFGWAPNAAGALTITCSNAGDANKVSVLWLPA